MATTNPIDEYPASLNEPKRATLTALRDTMVSRSTITFPQVGLLRALRGSQGALAAVVPARLVAITAYRLTISVTTQSGSDATEEENPGPSGRRGFAGSSSP